MTDTITTPRTLQYRLGTWTHPGQAQPMLGVEYLGELAEREARFDWAGLNVTREQWLATLQRYSERYAENASYQPPLYSPIGGEWVWTPDPDAEAEPLPEGREAQAQAIMVMRRREHEARQRAEQEARKAESAIASLNRLQARVEELSDALNEQAEERDWCSEFEEFASNFTDLITVKSKTYRITIEVTAGRGSDWGDYEVADHLYELDRTSLRDAIVSVDEVD